MDARIRRALVAGSLLLVAGAAVATLLAAIIAYRFSLHEPDWPDRRAVYVQYQHPLGAVFVTHIQGRGTEEAWIAPTWRQKPQTVADLSVNAHYQRIDHPQLPAWMELPDSSTQAHGLIPRAVGWPFPCYSGIERRLWRDAVNRSGQQYEFSGFITSQERPYPTIRIPARPLAAGLALNSAFFAATLGTGLWCARFVRTTLRRRRGLCPHCRYDLRATPADAPCPECGRTRHPP